MAAAKTAMNKLAAADTEVDMAKFRLPSFAPGTNTSRNTRVAGVPDFNGHHVAKTKMLVVALDYKNSKSLLSAGSDKGPLTCTIDAKNVEDLAKQCGCAVTAMYNEQCTKENVLAAIDKVGQSCQRDDFFVFYFAGHGTQIKDLNGDEEDGLDEAFVLVNSSGEVSNDTLLIDDDFSDAMYNAIDPRTRVLILADCGLDVADLSGRKWTGRKAISISGFLDPQKDHANLPNGIFTHSLLLGLDKIGHLEGLNNAKACSVGMVYNAALLEDAAVFASKQDLTIQSTADASADKIPWPLIPPAGYEAPLRQQAMGNPSPVGDGPPPSDEKKGGLQALITGCAPCKVPAHALLGTAGPKVSPLVLKNADLKDVLSAVAPTYGKMIQGTDLGLKLSRSCHTDKCVLS